MLAVGAIIHTLWREYWGCYSRLTHLMMKLGQSKRCDPSDEEVIYPENESGYVFLIKKRDQNKVTQLSTNTQSSGAAPQSFPPAGRDRPDVTGAAQEIVFLAVRMVMSNHSLLDPLQEKGNPKSHSQNLL